MRKVCKLDYIKSILLSYDWVDMDRTSNSIYYLQHLFWAGNVVSNYNVCIFPSIIAVCFVFNYFLVGTL